MTEPIPFNMMGFNLYAEKLKGFLGFRAKVVFRLQVNAMRFQQGRLIMGYIPTNDSWSALRLAQVTRNLTYTTQLPHVELDAADTEAILEVPYVNPQTYYNLTNGVGPYGTLFVNVYSPLSVGSGAPLNCEVTLWAHFEDVELVYPTAPTSFLPSSATEFVAQSGVKKRSGAGPGRMDVIDKELASKQLGPVSGFLDRVSKAAGHLADIPLISSYAQPASWVTSILSKAASALGFSKPTVAAPPGPVQLRAFAGMNLSNYADHSMKLSLMSDNHIQAMPGFAGTDLDEMSISYIAGIPAFIGSVPWTTSMTPGTNIVTKFMSPFLTGTSASLNAYENLGSGFVVHLPPFGYLSHLFKYWRGGITLTFKVVKTEFHSGRLMLTFYPGVSGSDATYVNSRYCFRQILDLRESNEFTYTIPFVNLQPWLNVDSGTGYVRLDVLNQLRAPDTVPNTVQVLIEVGGAPDFELAWPCGADNGTPALAFDNSGFAPDILEAQSGLARRVTNEVADSHFAPQGSQIDNSGVASTSTIAPSSLCIGECVTSIRQLLKRFVRLNTVITDVTDCTYRAPWASYIPSYSPTGVVSPITGELDYVSWLTPLFGFVRGGMRFKAIIEGNTSFSAVSNLYTAQSSVGTIFLEGTGSVVAPQLNNQPFSFPQFTGGLEVELAPYQRGHCWVTQVVAPSTTIPLNTTQVPGQALTILGSQSLADTQIFRAVSDDYSLGFFVGTVPIHYTL